MELYLGDLVVTKDPVVYGLGDASRKLPEGVVGEIVGVSPLGREYKVVFDYPGFRNDYVYARLGEEIFPVEDSAAPEVDVECFMKMLEV